MRVALGVALLWALVGVLLGVQSALGAAVLGAAPVPLGSAVRAGLRQVVPWVPVTLIVVALALRFPLDRGRWRRHALVHLAAAPLVAFAANVAVVLMFWASRGRFDGLAALAREGAVWAVARFLLALLVYAVVLALTGAVLHFRETRERELRLARVEAQLAEARLLALSAQLRPHFLFNTLHTIGQLWRSGRADDADAVLDRLGAMFHRVTRSTSRVAIPLGEELELVGDYLAIEQARFRDRLRARVVAPTDTLDCPVPPLILQPLVENAVRHGISAASSAGVVEVSARRDDGRLILTVRDDGPGVGAAPASPGAGMGLRNARERLAQLYGSAARLHVSDAPGGGALVRVEIPVAGHAAAEGSPG